MMDLDESLEFQELLSHYRKAKAKGLPYYIDSDDYIDIAEYYIAHESLQEAYEVVEEGLSYHSDNKDLLSLRANTLIGMNRFDEAEEAVAMLNPDDDHDTYYYSGQLACAQNHDYETAEKLFRKWLKIEVGQCKDMSDREEAATRKREAYMHIIMSLSDLAEEDDAQRLLPQWIDKYIQRCSPIPGDDIDVDIARICNINHLYSKEIELYNHILDSNPYMPQGWTYLASLQMVTGDVDGALNSVDFALAIDPDDTQALLVKGQGFLMRANYTVAEKSLRKYIELTHDDYYNIALANCLMQTEKKDAAYQLLEEYRLPVIRKVKDRSAKADMWAYIADIYLTGGYCTEAMRSINNALRMYPGATGYKMMKGSIYLGQKQMGKAVMCFLDATANADNPVKVMLGAAAELLEHGNLMPAMMFLKMVTRETDDPDHVRAYPYLAHCYFLLKMPKFFYESLEKACKYTPQMVGEFWKDDLMGIEPENYYQVLKNLYKDFGIKEKIKDGDFPEGLLDIEPTPGPF